MSCAFPARPSKTSYRHSDGSPVLYYARWQFISLLAANRLRRGQQQPTRSARSADTSQPTPAEKPDLIGFGKGVGIGSSLQLLCKGAENLISVMNFVPSTLGPGENKIQNSATPSASWVLGIEMVRMKGRRCVTLVYSLSTLTNHFGGTYRGP